MIGQVQLKLCVQGRSVRCGRIIHRADGAPDRGREFFASGDLGKPGVQLGHEHPLLDKDAPRVTGVIRVCVRRAAAATAPVVDHVVGPCAMHPAVAQAAEQQAGERVWPGAAPGPACYAPAAIRCEQLLHPPECLVVDDRRVRWLVGEDLLFSAVPAQFGCVAEDYIVYID
jgi:hypothetical protein